MQYVGYYYILIPLFFISLVALRRQPNKTAWIVASAPFVVVIAFLWATARWEIPGLYLRNIFPLLLIIALVIGYKRIQIAEKKPKKAVVIINYSINGITFFVITVMTIFAFLGYKHPSNMVDIKSPLRGGEYVVLHGGTRPFINAHAKIRPQNYALDLVAVNALLMRAESIKGGANLTDYVIFGANIFAPCDGQVLLAEDGLEDLTPPKTDPNHVAGNHVLLDCGDFELLLAHMKKDSITVKMGDSVTTESILGKVGNTGNTSEPHLHIHAETGGKENTILNGKGVAFTINGEFLVRGDLIEN